jgi:hypothetical protein
VRVEGGREGGREGREGKRGEGREGEVWIEDVCVRERVHERE